MFYIRVIQFKTEIDCSIDNTFTIIYARFFVAILGYWQWFPFNISYTFGPIR